MLWPFDGRGWFDALPKMSSGSRVAATGSQSFSLVNSSSYQYYEIMPINYVCARKKTSREGNDCLMLMEIVGNSKC